MSDENAPMDVLAERAGAVVKAAIAWRWGLIEGQLMTRAEWRLFEAATEYGDRYKGVRGQ